MKTFTRLALKANRYTNNADIGLEGFLDTFKEDADKYVKYQQKAKARSQNKFQVEKDMLVEVNDLLKTIDVSLKPKLKEISISPATFQRLSVNGMVGDYITELSNLIEIVENNTLIGTQSFFALYLLPELERLIEKYISRSEHKSAAELDQECLVIIRDLKKSKFLDIATVVTNFKKRNKPTLIIGNNVEVNKYIKKPNAAMYLLSPVEFFNSMRYIVSFDTNLEYIVDWHQSGFRKQNSVYVQLKRSSKSKRTTTALSGYEIMVLLKVVLRGLNALIKANLFYSIYTENDKIYKRCDKLLKTFKSIEFHKNSTEVAKLILMCSPYKAELLEYPILYLDVVLYWAIKAAIDIAIKSKYNLQK